MGDRERETEDVNGTVNGRLRMETEDVNGTVNGRPRMEIEDRSLDFPILLISKERL
jgi:hypothetical protein